MTRGSALDTVRRGLARPWVRGVALVVALGVAAVNWRRAPDAALGPALAGLALFSVGKYVLCPLRWHSLSASGQSRRWHLRVYAESEVLGMLAPVHAAADFWRVHGLHTVGMCRTAAVADVGLDRLVGAVALTLFAALGGAVLPPAVLAVAVGVALLALTAAWGARSRWPRLVEARPLPTRRQLVRGLGLSLAYQASIIGLLLGTVAAVGHEVAPLPLVAVFGASQLAGVVPGVHGATPREGALALGLVALGLPLTSALGAVALAALLAWLPAVAVGGTCLVLRRRGERRLDLGALAPAA